MEVISYGHIKAKKELCTGCGATIKYVPRDVQTWKPGAAHSKNCVRCPVCGSPIFVNVTFTKNDKYITFADVSDAEDSAVVKIKDLPFMNADIKTIAHNEVHDDGHVAWQSGYLACLKVVQKQVRDAAGISTQKEV